MGHKPQMTPQKDAALKRLVAADRALAHDRPMTDRDAEAKARELWGQFGFAWRHPHSKEGEPGYFRVGLAVGDVRDLWKPFGRGKDWESAFSDAKQRGWYC